MPTVGGVRGVAGAYPSSMDFQPPVSVGGASAFACGGAAPPRFHPTHADQSKGTPLGLAERVPIPSPKNAGQVVPGRTVGNAAGRSPHGAGRSNDSGGAGGAVSTNFSNKQPDNKQLQSQSMNNATTLQTHLQALSNEDPRCVFIVRK